MSDTKLAEDRPEGAPEEGKARFGDLTQGPILRTLLMFSIPTMFANVLQTIGGTVNTIWVGQLLGEGALAATSNANMVVFLAFATVFGFGTATTVKVGQYFGARDIDGARRTFGTGTGFSVALATVGSILGWIYADPLLRLLATPPAVHDLALPYIRVSFLGMPFATLSMMVSMGLRGAGDAKSPLYAMILTTILGIIINPLLILGIGPFPKLGIAGSALANALAAALGAAAMIGWAYWRDLPLRLKGRELAYLLPLKDELRFVLGKGVPMGAQMLIMSAASVIMFGLVNREGLLTAAAFGAVLQIWNYIQMPAFSISTGVSAMVAQNVGAGQHQRVGRITTIGVAVNSVITVVLTVLLLLLDAPLLGLFLGQDSGGIPIAERIQLLATWSWILTGVMMVVSGTLRSYGVVMLPLIIMVISQYGARIGFYELTYDRLGADALWWSYTFSSAVSFALTWLLYRYGGWRKVHIRTDSSEAAPATV